MDRAELDLSRIDGARHCDALGSRVGIIELPCDPFLEQRCARAARSRTARRESRELFRIRLDQACRQEVRLLLVVAFGQIRSPGRFTASSDAVVFSGAPIFAFGEFTTCGETFVAGSPFASPIDHIVKLPLMLSCWTGCRAHRCFPCRL
jgi:hypothetical protein